MTVSLKQFALLSLILTSCKPVRAPVDSGVQAIHVSESRLTADFRMDKNPSVDKIAEKIKTSLKVEIPDQHALNLASSILEVSASFGVDAEQLSSLLVRGFWNPNRINPCRINDCGVGEEMDMFFYKEVSQQVNLRSSSAYTYLNETIKNDRWLLRNFKNIISSKTKGSSDLEVEVISYGERGQYPASGLIYAAIVLKLKLAKDVRSSSLLGMYQKAERSFAGFGAKDPK